MWKRMLVQTAVVYVLSFLLSGQKDLSGLVLWQRVQRIHSGQGKMQGQEMIVWIMAAVLTSPLLALMEEFHSFCEKVLPSVLQKWAWGSTPR